MALRFVPFGPAHFAELASWFTSEADVVRWGGSQLHYPLDAAQLDTMVGCGTTDRPGISSWMISDGADLVGHGQLRFDWRNGNATLTRIAVAPARRGAGLAGPIVDRLIGLAFAYPDIARLELNVFALNRPAIRTYERAGFKVEGRRRSATIVEAERWDVVVMGLLRSERR